MFIVENLLRLSRKKTKSADTSVYLWGKKKGGGGGGGGGGGDDDSLDEDDDDNGSRHEDDAPRSILI